MKIEHIALWARDLEAMRTFYMRYFHGVSNEKYTNEAKGFESYFLSFESGARIELMRKPGLIDQADRINFMGYAHLAFSVGSKDRVIGLTETLRNDGFTIFGEPRTTGDGCFESVVLDPEGNLIEITV